MKRKTKHYQFYIHRIFSGKLKQQSCVLVVFIRILFFLGNVIYHYVKRPY